MRYLLAFALGMLLMFVFLWVGKVLPHQARDARVRAELKAVRAEFRASDGRVLRSWGAELDRIDRELAEPVWFR